MNPNADIKTAKNDILREIEAAEAALDALYKRKREIEDAEKEKRRIAKMDRHRLRVRMMQMASEGTTVSKIAEELGVSKHTVVNKISCVWSKEFPAHYAANREKIYRRGLLTALRDSPPIFISSYKVTPKPISG
jgi:FixJ family two-component response regulator